MRSLPSERLHSARYGAHACGWEGAAGPSTIFPVVSRPPPATDCCTHDLFSPSRHHSPPLCVAVMPFIFLGFMAATGENEDRSWRLCFLVPLGLHLASAALVMTGRDLPRSARRQLQGARDFRREAEVGLLGRRQGRRVQHQRLDLDDHLRDEFRRRAHRHQRGLAVLPRLPWHYARHLWRHRRNLWPDEPLRSLAGRPDF